MTVAIAVAIILFILVLLWNNKQAKAESSPKLEPVKAYEVITNSLADTKYQKMAHIFWAQAAHETGNFTSNIYKEANNLFGMKVPAVRPSARSGILPTKTGNYSKYKDLSDSVADMVLYLDYVRFPVTTNTITFVQELKKRNYFEDTVSNYLNGVSNFLTKVPQIS